MNTFEVLFCPAFQPKIIYIRAHCSETTKVTVVLKIASLDGRGGDPWVDRA
jgi:hypothetical protein